MSELAGGMAFEARSGTSPIGRLSVEGSVRPVAAATPAARFASLALDHVLVPLDGSPRADRALSFARAIVRAFHSRVTFLRVLESHHRPAEDVDALDWEIVAAEASAHLQRCADGFLRHGIDCSTALIPGRVGEQVNRLVQTHHADLIVLAGSAAPGSGSSVLGSGVQSVVGAARASVLIVPTDRPDFCGEDEDVGLSTILVGLDCSTRAECVLTPAVDLARFHGARLVLAHVVAEPEMPRRLQACPEDVELAGRLVERNRAEAASYLAEVAMRLAPSHHRVETVLRVGSGQAQALRELADEISADLVVISAHGQSGSATRRYGSVAAALLQECGRPLLLLQDNADGPQSPDVVTAVPPWGVTR